MKNIIRLLSTALAAGFLASCVDLEIPPKNILQSADIQNPGGIEAYLAGLYRMLPMDDFNVNQDGGGKEGYYHWNCIQYYETATGELAHRNGVFKEAKKGYWGEGWQIIRYANGLIEDLTAAGDALPGGAKWIAEAKFIRAYTYFQLARRYGGMPIIDKMQGFSNDFETLWVARSSEEKTYDFILKDLDDAAAGFGANDPLVAGRANRYVALAFKTRVAITAASIAKYGKAYEYMSKKEASTMLCGIPQSRANDYYEQAWKAAYEVEKSGKYALNGEGAASPEQQEAAFIGAFENADNSRESILIRKFGLTTTEHSFDVIYCPPRMTSTYGDRYGVTLDWMELFDGGALEGRADGRLNTTYLGADGQEYYRVFDNASALYEGMEPRLLASIMVPGRQYKGVTIDMRLGIIKESVDPTAPIARSTIPDDYSTTTLYDASSLGWQFFRDNVEMFTGGEKKHEQPVGSRLVTSTGTALYRNGLEGPHNNKNNNNTNQTGIQGRKWIDLNQPRSVGLHVSTSTWIDIRYAEVLLNRAEAAIELFQGGNTSENGSIAATATIAYDGKTVNLQQDAFEQINRIRRRAGANLLASPADLSKDPAYDRRTNPGKGAFVYAPNRGVQIVRVEYMKELFMEHKVYWAQGRWFARHKMINNYRRRGLYPLLFAKGAVTRADASREVPDGKYIYDTRVILGGVGDPITYDGNRRNYYEDIPELTRNPLMEGNEGQ